MTFSRVNFNFTLTFTFTLTLPENATPFKQPTDQGVIKILSVIIDMVSLATL